MKILITNAQHRKDIEFIVRRILHLLDRDYGIELDEFDDKMIKEITLDIYSNWYL